MARLSAKDQAELRKVWFTLDMIIANKQAPLIVKSAAERASAILLGVIGRNS